MKSNSRSNRRTGLWQFAESATLAAFFGQQNPAQQPQGNPQQQAGQGAPQQAAAQPAAQAAQQEDDFSDFVFAGLVGSGGGGLTALVLAAREGDIESAKLLLQAGADINQTSEYGWTPLLTATNNRHYTLAEYLVERGADVNKANKGNWTPLYLATDNRNIEGGDFRYRSRTWTIWITSSFFWSTARIRTFV
jgi:hypothetical protein